MRVPIGFWRCGFGMLLVVACVLGVAGSAWAATAHVTNAGTNTLTRVDLASNALASAIEVRGGPSEVVINHTPASPACVVRNARTHSTSATLQEAVEAAAGGDTLEVTGICKGDTTITSATSPLRIKGNIDHAQLNGEQEDGSVLAVEAGASVAVFGVTITGGHAAEGGGIHNEGELTLTGSWVIDNRADFGGGIFNYAGGAITLEESHVGANTGLLGGGIVNGGGSYIALIRSVVASSNTAVFGGGVDNIEAGSILTLNASRIEDNTAVFGGGLDDNNDSLTTMYGSSISGNKADQGGGVINDGESTLTLNSASKIVENKATGGKGNGGGVYITDGSTLNANGANISKNTPENIFEEP